MGSMANAGIFSAPLSKVNFQPNMLLTHIMDPSKKKATSDIELVILSVILYVEGCFALQKNTAAIVFILRLPLILLNRVISFREI